MVRNNKFSQLDLLTMDQHEFTNLVPEDFFLWCILALPDIKMLEARKQQAKLRTKDLVQAKIYVS